MGMRGCVPHWQVSGIECSWSLIVVRFVVLGDCRFSTPQNVVFGSGVDCIAHSFGIYEIDCLLRTYAILC